MLNALVMMHYNLLLLIKIETGAEDDEMDDSDSLSNEILDLSKITEMRLVPSDPNQGMFCRSFFFEGQVCNPSICAYIFLSCG